MKKCLINGISPYIALIQALYMESVPPINRILFVMAIDLRLPKSQNNRRPRVENLFAFLLSSSCWDQMSLSLVLGSFFNKRLSLGYR